MAAPETTAPVSKTTGRGMASRGARSQVTKQARASGELAAAWTTIADDDEVYVMPMHQKEAADSAECAAQESSGNDENVEDLNFLMCICFVLQRVEGVFFPVGQGLFFPSSVYGESHHEDSTPHLHPRTFHPKTTSRHQHKRTHDTSTTHRSHAPNTRSRRWPGQ